MMKTVFIPAKIKSSIGKSGILNISKKLPKSIAIAYSIQYKDAAFEIKKALSKNHQITSCIQVLGCSRPKFRKDTEAILLITDGKFHGVSLAYEAKLPVFILNSQTFKMIPKKEAEALEKRKKSAYLKFLNAENVGILVSTKPGQQNLLKAFELKRKLSRKKTYIFLGDNIDSMEFENFMIDSWVNTACPRLDMSSGLMINMNDIPLR